MIDDDIRLDVAEPTMDPLTAHLKQGTARKAISALSVTSLDDFSAVELMAIANRMDDLSRYARLRAALIGGKR